MLSVTVQTFWARAALLQLFLLIMKYILLFIVALLGCARCYAQDYQSWLDRCEQYRDNVQNILVSNGVSPDYYFLMVAESRCTVNAESNKGAQGFWQLTRATSKHYGCDNPHNLECATRAAALYIKHLQNDFKTFNDTIMAYNMGGHNYRCAKQPTNEAKWLVVKVLRLINDYQRLNSEINEAP